MLQRCSTGVMIASVIARSVCASASRMPLLIAPMYSSARIYSTPSVSECGNVLAGYSAIKAPFGTTHMM